MALSPSSSRGDAAGASIPKSIFDAKGDLLAASAADTPARLAPGTDGQGLVLDAAQAAGLRWADLATLSSGLVPTTQLGGSGASGQKALAGDQTWKAASLWTQIIVKSADQDVSNTTTPANDNELAFAVVAGYYLCEFHVIYSASDGTADYRYVWTFPALQGQWTAIGRIQRTDISGSLNPQDLASAVGGSQWPSSEVGAGTTTNLSLANVLYGQFMFAPGSSGTLQFKFANWSGTTFTARTWAGTTMKLLRLA